MKQISLHLLLLWVILFPLQLHPSTNDSISKLNKLLLETPQVSDIRPIQSNEFTEKYQFFITQPLDHAHPEKGSFRQRVILSHVGFDRPTLLITEGYGAQYALNPNYREELSKLFNMNMLFVEYRYFLESTPQPTNWEYLTVENSVHDLHHINTIFKKLYPEKWVSTGISKGGQTTMFYRAYFPNDVDFSIPYVAPLNRSVEDGRHEPFLHSQVGTSEQRKKILDYQMELCKRKNDLIPTLRDYCEKKKIHFRRPIEEVFDFCILEYPFAFWQWGTSFEKIPALDSSNQTLIDHLIEMADPSYFSDQSPYVPFDVQALRELGYYGYDIRPYKKYFTLKTSKNYLCKLMVPKELEGIQFDKTLYKKTRKFLLENDPKMIYIYGGNDPWSASGVTDPRYFKNKKNLKLYIQPGGSHRARIQNMPDSLRTEIINQIHLWLQE